ncbi:MAG: hypothetical protein WB579_20550 [Bryobacteraceae bacterium]
MAALVTRQAKNRRQDRRRYCSSYSVEAPGPGIARLHRLTVGAQAINLPHNAVFNELVIHCGLRGN